MNTHSQGFQNFEQTQFIQLTSKKIYSNSLLIDRTLYHEIMSMQISFRKSQGKHTQDILQGSDNESLRIENHL